MTTRRGPAGSGIWAVVPVKEFASAKQRLGIACTPAFRRALAPAMLHDVLAALRASQRLSGILVVTVDPVAIAMAAQAGARVLTAGATIGHTAAVAAGMRHVLGLGAAGMLTVPGDIPGVTGVEIDALLAGHGEAPSFSIVPAHDGRGSNAIVCSRPDVLDLHFGNDSCRPHIAAAHAAGLSPRVATFEGIGMDIDEPDDLIRFAGKRWPTRAQALIERSGILETVS